jgi:hypothetical protein
MARRRIIAAIARGDDALAQPDCLNRCQVWATVAALMPIARAALWYQLLDLNIVDRRAGFRFLLTGFPDCPLRCFLVRLLNMYSSSCKLPRGLRPVREVPPKGSIPRHRRITQSCLNTTQAC